MFVYCQVLAKLLIVGITDGDGDIRYCVLDSLSLSFDYHLAQGYYIYFPFV